jgi:hypothetical protein
MHADIKVFVDTDFAYGYRVPLGDSLLEFFKGSPEFVEVDKNIKIPLKGDSYSQEFGFVYLNEEERYFNEMTEESTVIAFIENGTVNRSMIYPHGVALNDAVIAALLSNPTFVFEE